MDSNVLNFGHFTCGRTLRQKFIVHNDGHCDKYVTIKFGSQDEFTSTQIYQCEELPFEYHGQHPIPNSEKQFKSWFLRDPLNKKEAKNKKKISFALPSGGHQEITVSLKAPTDQLNAKMVS